MVAMANGGDVVREFLQFSANKLKDEGDDKLMRSFDKRLTQKRPPRHRSGGAVGSRVRLALIGLACALGSAGARAESDGQAKRTPYPTMAAVEKYHASSAAEEIALARSAAPASISDHATVLVLGARGYETAAQGDNGFVCLVQRAWANDFSSSEFWNPRVQAPLCFNGAGAQSVLPDYLTRTEWALSGVSKQEMLVRTRAAVERHDIRPPQAGAMAYMLSKDGYLGDEVGGPWHAHLMVFMPSESPSAWGANLPGAPVMGGTDSTEPITTFYVIVNQWSDGSPAPAMEPHA
jgi:hypothetical protein